MPGPGSVSAPKPDKRARQRKTSRDVKAALWREVVRAVMQRDGYCCRVCCSRDQVDPHHIKFRSAGGDDSPRNVAAICRVCHDDIHAYRLALGGDANKKLTITRIS